MPKLMLASPLFKPPLEPRVTIRNETLDDLISMKLVGFWLLKGTVL